MKTPKKGEKKKTSFLFQVRCRQANQCTTDFVKIHKVIPQEPLLPLKIVFQNIFLFVFANDAYYSYQCIHLKMPNQFELAISVIIVHKKLSENFQSDELWLWQLCRNNVSYLKITNYGRVLLVQYMLNNRHMDAFFKNYF